MKNLIRNGGFERGTTDFWTTSGAKSFEVVDTPVHKGDHAGKITCDGANYPLVIPNDYIPMQVGESAYYEAAVRANGLYSAYLRVEYYDEGLSVIETVTYASFNPGQSGYEQVLEVISGIEGAIYCRPYLYLAHDTEDDYMLIDNVAMYKFSAEDSIGAVRLMDEREELDTANTYTSPWSIVMPYKEAAFTLYVGTLTGTTDTLNVTIEAKSIFHSNEVVIATFEEATSSDDQQTIVLTEGIGTKIRVKAVLAGTSLDCDYWLEAVFKR